MIVEFKGKYPKVDPTAFVAENATGIGDVEIGPGTNIWFHRIVRGDLNYIRIGSNCNIQDACVLHVEKDFYPLFLEDEVVLGHRVVVHGCKIGRGSMIGQLYREYPRVKGIWMRAIREDGRYYIC